MSMTTTKINYGSSGKHESFFLCFVLKMIDNLFLDLYNNYMHVYKFVQKQRRV